MSTMNPHEDNISVNGILNTSYGTHLMKVHFSEILF